MGYANTGGTTNCNKTVCFPVGPCVPELDSQNAAIAWGPLTAANFQADYEVIAWSGAGVGTFSVPESNVDATLPTWIGESQYPTDGEIFLRQVAADNTSMVSNFSSWVPQVRCNHTSLNMACTRQSIVCPATWQLIDLSSSQPPHADTCSFLAQVYAIYVAARRSIYIKIGLPASLPNMMCMHKALLL